jgi:hypothetical protein
MTNSIALEDDEPTDIALPEPDEGEDAYEQTGKVRSMTPVMILLVPATVGFIAFQAYNVAAGVWLLLTGNEYNRLRISDAEMAQAFQVFEAWRLPPSLTGLTALATIIAFLWFNVRAVSNIRAFSRHHVPASPLSVVLWQFVPVLNLVKPYSLMMMYWSRTHETAAKPADGPALGLWWWIAWVAAILFVSLSRLVDQIDVGRVQAGPVSGIPLRALGLATTSSACFVISALAMLAITSGIARAQNGIRKAMVAQSVF